MFNSNFLRLFGTNFARDMLEGFDWWCSILQQNSMKKIEVQRDLMNI